MAAASATKAGVNARAYRNTGTYGSPTWTAVNLIKDGSIAAPWDMVEAGARQTRAKLYGKTRIDIQIGLTVRADDADAGYNALADAAMSQTSVVDMLVLSGPITTEGVRGFRAQFLVNESSQAQEIDGIIYDSFDLKPSFTTDGFPSSVVMGAGSTPAFTAF